MAVLSMSVQHFLGGLITTLTFTTMMHCTQRAEESIQVTKTSLTVCSLDLFLVPVVLFSSIRSYPTPLQIPYFSLWSRKESLCSFLVFIFSNLTWLYVLFCNIKSFYLRDCQKGALPHLLPALPAASHQLFPTVKSQHQYLLNHLLLSSFLSVFICLRLPYQVHF